MVRVEWKLQYENGGTQEISITRDDGSDGDMLTYKRLAKARGATLLCRTITTTEWATPTIIKAQA